MRPDFERNGGLIRVIAQDAVTYEVLMDAFMSEEAFDETMRTGRVVYYSRSRMRIWRKGEESGHVQLVRSIRINCNRDALLILVEQVGLAACHDGYRSCYYREITDDGWKVISERVFDPQVVYGKKGT
ncbi:phosphoribosyl-AMP cyclohydrolase [Candidatus Peregrinibacteria bacterium CG1_02_54_53]|nr:MAG: phosphoribosyl-AMP cyclohydrolase [Candidatus Peregrinibacteria bacterium CG1_02_54_53]